MRKVPKGKIIVAINKVNRTKLRRVKPMELKVVIEQDAPIEYNMRQIRDIAQRVMKEKGLTEIDVRKTLGVKRYEK